jgi:membrane protease YdiL (CAAX protease family)
VKSLGLLGLAAGVLLVTALASPWVAWALGPGFSFPRVFDRVFEVLLVVAAALAWRRLDLGDAGGIGFRRRGWSRALVRGVAIGAAGIAVGLGLSAFLGALAPELRFGAWKTVRRAILGLVAALAIGVGEEALFRGVLLRRLCRDLGSAAGIAVTTAVYAAVHVVRRRGDLGAVHGGSGFAELGVLFAHLANASVLPEIVGLGLLGVVLAAGRLRSGTLWLPIGIHAVFVAAFRVGRLFFEIAPGPAWLVGTGWPPLMGGAAGWVAVAVAGSLVARQRRS